MEGLAPCTFWDALVLHMLLASQPRSLGFSRTVFILSDGPDGEFSLLSFSTEPSAGPGLLGEIEFLEDTMWGRVRWERARFYITTAQSRC